MDDREIMNKQQTLGKNLLSKVNKLSDEQIIKLLTGLTMDTLGWNELFQQNGRFFEVERKIKNSSPQEIVVKVIIDNWEEESFVWTWHRLIRIKNKKEETLMTSNLYHLLDLLSAE